MRCKILLAVFVCVALLNPLTSLAQDQTVISGKITDETGEALPGANIFIQLTNNGAATDINGDFEFTVPASAVRGQEVKLVARFIGYRTKTTKLTLTPGSHTVNFQLAFDVLEMDAIVVTGVVEETPRTKLAFSVGRVSRQQLEQVPTSSAQTALRGKVAGVRIIQGSGEPGADASIMLRAPTSINSDGRSQDPLFIIDGVIIDPSVSGSPLSDINAEDIESIEVVKGAAGASLYGSRAANGVINITTNRGKGLAINQTRIRIRNEFGINKIDKEYPLNHSHWFRLHDDTNIAARGETYTDANGIKVTPGDFIDNEGNWADPRTQQRVGDRYNGNYDPDNPDEGRIAQMFFSDNPYKWKSTGDIIIDDLGLLVLDPATQQPLGLQRLDASNRVDNFNQFFDAGSFINNTVSLSRNMENTNFSISLGNRRETGVVEGLRGYERQNLRIGLDHKFRKDLTLGISAFYSNVQRDDITTGPGSAFFGIAFIAADADLLLRHGEAGTLTTIYPDGIPLDIAGELFFLPDPYAPRDNPLYEPSTALRKDKSQRFMGSMNLSYQPVNWFKVNGNFSYDRSNRERNRFFRVGYQDEFDSAIALGRFQKFPAFDEAINGSVTASFQKSFLNNELTIRSKARGLLERTEFQNTFVEGNDFVVRGVRDLGNTDPLLSDINSRIEEVRSQGYSFISGLDYKDRYIADFLVRRDGSSLFGPDERWHNYYRVSGAYRLSEEDWFSDFFDEFKIRASFGTAGGRPNFFARYETWTVSGGNVSKSTLGNRELKPEFAKELEFGVDLAFMEKFSLELTRAESTVEDQLLEVPLASYQGYTTQWQNAGTLETSTWEASLQGVLMRKRDMSLSFGLNFDRTRQTISKLDVPAYIYNPPFQSVSVFRIQEGEEFGALFGDIMTYNVQDLLPRGLSQAELSQFDINDEGYVVWVGDGNTFREGFSQQLWGTQAELSDGDTYEWGMPIIFEDAEGTSQFIMGGTQPDFNWSFFTNFNWKGFSIYGLLDAQVGGDVWSLTEQWGYGIEARSAQVDQAGKPEDLKKPVRYYRLLQSAEDTFVFDGSFVKLRELAVKYSFNRNQLGGLFGGILNKVSIGFIGRNLFSFDNYDRGTDPEVGVRSSGDQGGSAVVSRYDAFNYPNFRVFSGILEIEL